MGDWNYLRHRTSPIHRSMVLELAVRLSHHVAGNIIEFGVYYGISTRIIRESLSRCERDQVGGGRKKVFACDSFKGLPEKFEKLEIGALACDPPKIPGVEIVQGYFQESLTPQLASRVGSVAFASLDADLYSSTLCALKWLTPLLHTGSLLLFDEFLGENESEKRAFNEWSSENRIRTLQLAEFVRDPSGNGER